MYYDNPHNHFNAAHWHINKICSFLTFFTNNEIQGFHSRRHIWKMFEEWNGEERKTDRIMKSDLCVYMQYQNVTTRWKHNTIKLLIIFTETICCCWISISPNTARHWPKYKTLIFKFSDKYCETVKCELFMFSDADC